MKRTEELEEKIGYRFQDKSLMEKALTHSSCVNEMNLKKSDCNERLEFLGDAVLELATSEFFFNKFSDSQEGNLTQLRQRRVCGENLAKVGKNIQLSSYIRTGKGVKNIEANIVEDAFEALIGAVFLDGGYEKAKKIVIEKVLKDYTTSKPEISFKNKLQENMQKKTKVAPTYELLAKEGPDNHPTFYCVVKAKNKILGEGKGASRKKAEEAAAANALKQILPNSK